MARCVGKCQLRWQAAAESGPGGRPGGSLDRAQVANPVHSQRELGRRLGELRNGLGLTVEGVAERLLCSPTKISRLETGSRRASLRDVRDLCLLYRVSDEAQADELMRLA
jgi:hypothetical protein